MTAFRFALATALLPLLAAPVVAQTTGSTDAPATAAGQIFASDPQAIMAEMQRLGYRAEMTTDDQGDPKIKSAAGGANFSIYFYGCEAGKDCTSIQFSAGFDTTNGLDMAVANDWNTRKRYGKVYLDDERDPYIEMDIDMDGGMRTELFADNLGIWDRMLADFQRHIDW